MIFKNSKFKPFSILTLCLAASGCLAIAPAAFSQSVKLHIDGEGVQHLTCIKDAQGLMCKTEERDSEPAENPGNDLEAGVPESLKVSSITTVPPKLSSAQLELISNVLLGFLYFVLPIGIGLGIFLHDKYSSYRSAILDQQIMILERLWMQSPHS
jgi:hypothetical protein